MHEFTPPPDNTDTPPAEPNTDPSAEGECAVDQAMNATEPGVFDCTRPTCDNPNASLLTEGIAYRDDGGNVVRPDIWPAYCEQDKLAGLPTAPFEEILTDMQVRDALGHGSGLTISPPDETIETVDITAPEDRRPTETLDVFGIASAGADKSASGETPETAANEADPSTEPSEPPSDTADDPTVPPVDNPPERLDSPGSPDRGAELAKVINYARNFVEETRKALEASVRAIPGGDEVIASLTQRGISLEEAVYSMPDPEGEEGSSLGSRYHEKEQGYARLQYGEALTASGLELQEGNDYEVRILMTNPEAFAAALSTVTPPEDPEQRAGFGAQIDDIIDKAMTTAGAVIIDQRRDETGTMCGEYAYQVQPTPYSWFPSPEQATVGNTLPEQADTIARQMPRLGVSDETASQVRTLAAAQREGLVTEWGVARTLDILDQPHRRISAAPGKIGHEFYWNAAYKFLEHLRDTAPNAQLTQDVRRTILNDLDAAAGTPHAQKAQQVRERVLRILP